jgi:hypothetical protein
MTVLLYAIATANTRDAAPGDDRENSLLRRITRRDNASGSTMLATSMMSFLAKVLLWQVGAGSRRGKTTELTTDAKCRHDTLLSSHCAGYDHRPRARVAWWRAVLQRRQMWRGVRSTVRCAAASRPCNVRCVCVWDWCVRAQVRGMHGSRRRTSEWHPSHNTSHAACRRWRMDAIKTVHLSRISKNANIRRSRSRRMSCGRIDNVLRAPRHGPHRPESPTMV